MFPVLRTISAVVCAFALAIAAAPPADADVFRILDDPREAAQARVDLFQQAQSEIDALYFLARRDRITFAALSLLRDARRRGVGSVRLIVDANFQHIPKEVLAYLSDEGVQVRVYHPLTLRHPSWLFRRMHDKVVVVDGKRYITGGRNLAEAYFGLATKKNFVDRDVYVEGPSAEEADRYFEALWSSRDVATLQVHVSPEAKVRAAEMLDASVDTLVGKGFLELDTCHDWSAGQDTSPTVQFLHDPVVPADGERLTPQISEFFAGARESIVVESPYVIPSTSILQLLEKKAAEGVSVTIVTNSLRSTDGVLPQAAYLKNRRRVLRAGIDIREYKGRDTLHAKSAVIDGQIAMIGTYNVDPRSQNLNTEIMCVVDDAAAAEALLASIEQHKKNAWTIRAGRLPRERYPGVSRAARFRVWVAHLLLPLIQGQL